MQVLQFKEKENELCFADLQKIRLMQIETYEKMIEMVKLQEVDLNQKNVLKDLVQKQKKTKEKYDQKMMPDVAEIDQILSYLS